MTRRLGGWRAWRGRAGGGRSWRAGRRGWRWVGVVALVVGLGVAARWRPQTPGAWGVVERFGFAAAECEARLAARQSAPFTLPAGHPGPVPVPEVARWFHLDPAAVCAANDLPAAECTSSTLAPGEGLALPLAREAQEGP